jgi:hypothetical protein
MKKALMAAVLATAMAAPLVPAQAQYGRHDYRWDGDRHDRHWDPAQHYHPGRYRERRLTRADRVYRGRDGRYYCRRSDGTTGLVVGALAGGVLGNAIGGDTLSTLLGGAAGGLLGQSIDRGEVKCR